MLVSSVGSLQLNVVLTHMWGDIRYTLPHFDIAMSELKNMDDIDYFHDTVTTWFHNPPHHIPPELAQKLRFFKSMINAINASFSGNPLW